MVNWSNINIRKRFSAVIEKHWNLIPYPGLWTISLNTRTASSLLIFSKFTSLTCERGRRDQKSTCLIVFNMPYLTEVFYKEWSAFNSEKNKSKAVEMVHIPAEAYLQVLFYHLNPLHPCIDKETCEKKVQNYATYFTKQTITMSYIY